MKNIRHKIGLLSILGIIVFASLSFVMALRYWHLTTETKQELSRERALEVVAALKSGMSRDKVLQIFSEYKWTSFGNADGEIRLWTYPQPLPTNWIIRLFFEDDRLVAVRYGNADNIEKHPEDAPPDIFFNLEKNKVSCSKRE